MVTEPGRRWRLRLWSDMAVIGKALSMEGTDLTDFRRGRYKEESQLEPTGWACAFQGGHSGQPEAEHDKVWPRGTRLLL